MTAALAVCLVVVAIGLAFVVGAGLGFCFGAKCGAEGEKRRRVMLPPRMETRGTVTADPMPRHPPPRDTLAECCKSDSCKSSALTDPISRIRARVLHRSPQNTGRSFDA